jgi:putative flippase GtrA
MSILRRRGVRQFVKFGLVGLSSTVIDWGIYLILTRFLGVFYLMAKILSFSIAVINSYIWNRRWTFRSNDPAKLRQFIKFLTISLVGLVLNSLIMYLAVEHLKLADIYGLVLATAIVTIWNFLANKFYTFKV